MIDTLILIVILSLVIYRVARFIVLDSLIDGTRDKVLDWLERRHDKTQHLVYEKLADLIGCPFCITIWVGAGACFATRLFVGSFPMPVWVWLATCGLSLTWWSYIDSDD